MSRNNTIKRQGGFTLLELSITVTIIGVLAAIASLSYQDYQAQAHDREAQTALRLVVIGEEAYFIEHSTYVSCDQTTCPLLLPGVNTLPASILLNFVSAGASCSGTASHPRGSGQTFNWSS